MNIKIFALCCFSPLFMSIISTNAFASVVFLVNNSYSSHVGTLQNMATRSVDNYSFSSDYSGQIPNGQVHDYISEFVATPASTINLVVSTIFRTLHPRVAPVTSHAAVYGKGDRFIFCIKDWKINLSPFLFKD